MKYVGAALAAASLFASPAISAVPQGREKVTISVSTEGLNLSSVEGVQRLRDRVDRAIAKACNPGDRLDADMSPDFQCRREMASSVLPTLAKIELRATGASISRN